MRISLPAPLRHTVSTRRVCARSAMAASSKITLYSNPRTRGQVVEWCAHACPVPTSISRRRRYLKELGVAFDLRVLDLAAKEQKTDWFLEINPFGKLPALQDGDVTLFESGAILLYLAETCGGADTAAKRAELAKWILFANSTMVRAIYCITQQPRIAHTHTPVHRFVFRAIP